MEVVEDKTDKKVDLTLIKQSVVLSADERTLYVNVAAEGLDIFDISDPKNPRLLRNYSTEDSTYALIRKDSKLFLANGLEGVEVLDISDPNHLLRLAYIRTDDDNATSVALADDGKTLAIGTEEGILLYDIEKITMPRFLGDFDTNGTVRDLRFSNDLKSLYLANFDYGLELLDIRYPNNIERMSAVAMEGSACDIEQPLLSSSDRLYVASLTSTVKKVDITDLNEPELRYYYDPHDGSQIWDMQFDATGRWLYLAKASRGFEIVGIDALGNALHVGGYDTNATARGVAVNSARTFAYVADGEEGLKVFDISDPKNVERVGIISF
jgi:hypothetical protein